MYASTAVHYAQAQSTYQPLVVDRSWHRAIDLLSVRAFGLAIKVVYSNSLPHRFALYWVVGRDVSTCRIGGIR